MTHLRGLLVDYGGVLTTSIGDAFRAFCEREGVEHDRLKELLRSAYAVGTEPDAVIAAMETGRIEAAEFERRIAEVLSEGLHRPVRPEGLLGRMLEGVGLEPVMVEAVRAARRAGVRTALLSNSWGTDIYPRDLLAELFDAVVVSGEVGMRKPDPGIFRLAARRLDLEPEACVFVDDVEGNVKAARALGMRGILHEDPEGTVSELAAVLGVALR